MLDKETRKHLLEQWEKEPYSGQEWENALKRKEDTNPHQTWYRTRDKAREAIKDLILLANTLPEEKQAELFDYKTVNKLTRAILGYELSRKLRNERMDLKPLEDLSAYEKKKAEEVRANWENFEAILDIRRVDIARGLTEQCTNYCISKYILTEYSTSLCEPVIESLQKSKDLLAAIASKVERLQKEREGATEYMGGEPTRYMIERQTMEILAGYYRNNPTELLKWMKQKDKNEAEKKGKKP